MKRNVQLEKKIYVRHVEHILREMNNKELKKKVWYEHKLFYILLGFLLTGLIVPFMKFNYDLMSKNKSLKLRMIENDEIQLKKIENEIIKMYSETSKVLIHYRSYENKAFDEESLNDLLIEVNSNNITSKTTALIYLKAITNRSYTSTIENNLTKLNNRIQDFSSFNNQYSSMKDIDKRFNKIKDIYENLLESITIKRRDLFYEKSNAFNLF